MAVVRYRADDTTPPQKAEYDDPQKRIRWSVQGVRRIANKRAQRRVEPADVIAWSCLCQRRIKTRPAWRRKSRPLDCDVTDMRTAPAGAVLISAACLAVGISCR
ncbi:hypothetical protein FE249_02295 [Acidiphilium multivorum]|nr:hypothetical protein FE249_02295 [Acidiphilium multivorum]